MTNDTRKTLEDAIEAYASRLCDEVGAFEAHGANAAIILKKTTDEAWDSVMDLLDALDANA